MLQGWVVIACALGYIGLLFVIASYGDRTRRFGREGRWRHFIYPLSLAIYCTSWTFFGSVGLASRTGFDFLPIYIGPILMIGLASPLITRIVRLAKAQNITSIADFIAARYGKAQTVAATVALIAIIGTIPYIALQLKAVSSSLTTILVHIGPASSAMQPVLGDMALYVALAMAIFAVLFGTRHIDATEHQDGLMLAIATESIVKLIAFVGVGVFVTFWLFDGPLSLFAQALERPNTAAVLTREPVPGTILAMTLLSLFAIILLPRQFHVTVVENNNEGEIRRAAWLFPLYLVLINLFVVPIALAGLLTFEPGQVDSDMFVLALPIAANSDLFTLVAFIGGLLAATAMGIVGTGILGDGPFGLALLRPRALLGLDLPPLVHGVAWSLSLNLLAYVVFSLSRAPTSIERLQADLFVPSELAPMTPSFRLWRSSVTIEELTTSVARYLGEERTRTSFESYAATRALHLDPKGEADFQLLRYAEHL